MATDHGAVEPEVAWRLALNERFKDLLSADAVACLETSDVKSESLLRGWWRVWRNIMPGCRGRCEDGVRDG